MTIPACSVVIPTFNRSDLVVRAIASVLAQTDPDFELLVVDDASTDDTAEVVGRISDPRLRYLRQTENRGLAATRNAGIRAARAPIVAFLDDDDELLPRYLAAKRAAFAAAGPEVGFVACGVREIDERTVPPAVDDKVPADDRHPDRETAYRDFLRRIPFSGWFVAIRRAALDEVGGFDEAVRTEQDRDLLYRLVRRYEYRVVPEVLALHYFHAGPHVNVYGPKKAAAYRHIMAKHLPAIAADRGLWAAWHYKMGWLHYRAQEPAEARRHLLRGLRRVPWHLRSWYVLLTHELPGAVGPRAHAWLSAARKTRRRSRTA